MVLLRLMQLRWLRGRHLALQADWHDFAQGELNILLVLVLIRDQDQVAEEDEGLLSLVNAWVLDADLQEPLWHVKDADVLNRLAAAFADFYKVVEDVVDLLDYFCVLLILIEQLHKVGQLVFVDQD